MSMDIGCAVKALKDGKRVTRAAWHAGMFVYYVPASRYDAYTDAGKSIAGDDGKVAYNAYLAAKSNHSAVNVWFPALADILADDWHIV